jgi:hypothetical protein
MKRLLKKIESALTAAAFAEEGEAETAREILREAGAEENADPERRRPLVRPGGPAAPLAKGSRA